MFTVVKFVPINIVAAVKLETFRSHVGFKLIQLISDRIKKEVFMNAIPTGSKTEIIPDFCSN